MLQHHVLVLFASLPFLHVEVLEILQGITKISDQPRFPWGTSHPMSLQGGLSTKELFMTFFPSGQH